MKRAELLENAKKLHRYMLGQNNPRYALPRLGLALDLASLEPVGTHVLCNPEGRRLALARITQFVEGNG